MLRDSPYSTTFTGGPCSTVYYNSADNFDGGWHMYGVRLRQPKTSNDFGRRPERHPAGKIEFALRPPTLPDMAAAASSKRHFRGPPNPYQSLLHSELDFLPEGPLRRRLHDGDVLPGAGLSKGTACSADFLLIPIPSPPVSLRPPSPLQSDPLSLYQKGAKD